MSRADSITAQDLVGEQGFVDRGYPHDAWRVLREEEPLRYFDLGERPGFWAVVRRADIVWISKQPERFLNAPRLAVFPDSPGRQRDGSRQPIVRHLLNMDPPEHARYRSMASSWFTPRAIERRRPEIERISRALLDGLVGREQVDFVGDYTAPLTLSVLADMLGVPREDWRRIFEWTNQMAGPSDPEYQLSANPSDSMRATTGEMFEYFGGMVAERRRKPGDDIVSVLAGAEIDGKPIPPFELLSFLTLLVVAGNETTRNAASGGLMAMIERPEALETLRRHPGLIGRATEETIRWTSPVIQFCRTAAEDVERNGRMIRKGDSLCLFYPSANRDAEVFEAPDEFRIDRSPNPHVGFGIGEHFCLGANLARLEIRIALEQLASRIDRVELAGPVERVRSSFLGGMKRMPLRMELKPAD